MPVTPSVLAPPARPRRKGENTAERILDSAEALFSERGYEGTTLRDVADAVGLRIPSLYNHFDSKDSLYAAVLERSAGPVLEVLSEFMREGGAAYHDARIVVSNVMDLLARDPQLPRLVLHETLSGGQRLTPVLREWIAPIFSKAGEMVHDGPASRSWDSEQIPHLVLGMYHMVVGYFAIAPLYTALNGEDLMSREAIERQKRFLVEVVERLFGNED
jgi:AcrR family transcriptional regulator